MLQLIVTERPKRIAKRQMDEWEVIQADKHYYIFRVFEQNGREHAGRSLAKTKAADMLAEGAIRRKPATDNEFIQEINSAKWALLQVWTANACQQPVQQLTFNP